MLALRAMQQAPWKAVYSVPVCLWVQDRAWGGAPTGSLQHRRHRSSPSSSRHLLVVGARSQEPLLGSWNGHSAEQTGHPGVRERAKRHPIFSCSFNWTLLAVPNRRKNELGILCFYSALRRCQSFALPFLVKVDFRFWVIYLNSYTVIFKYPI